MDVVKPRFRYGLLLIWLVASAQAAIDVALQMQLGNPSGATIDPANHQHYLIQRAQYALDFSDVRGEPLWVSWDLTAGDVGSAPRTTTYSADRSLPATFYAVTDSDYVGVGAINFNRGHMCPSEDRTVTVADNQQLFLFTNIVPQAADNNQGPWEVFESYCRTLAAAGNELLIICGPSGFSAGTLLPSGKAAIPAYVWKIVVVVPPGAGPAASRVTASTRVIALKMPNLNGIRGVAWQSYVTTVSQIETDTGFTFFTALPTAVANSLRTVVDAASTVGAPSIVTQPVAQAAFLGGSVTFNVAASGNSPLAYQWSRDGVALAGATAATLSLSNVQAADFGAYSVLISNAIGSVASNAVTLSAASPVGSTLALAWDFTGANPSSGLPADLSITGGELAQGNNNGTTAMLATTSVSSGYAGASAGANAGAAARTGTLNRAANGSAYFEFTLTPAAGKLLWITGLSFGSRSTGTGPQAFAVYSGADNFTLPVAAGPLTNNSVWSRQSPALNPIAGRVGGAVTLRIYGFSGAGGAAVGTANWRIDDLSVNVAALAGPPQNPTRVANFSSRALTAVAEQAAFAGFVIGGQGTKTLLVRAVGPTLAGYGVPTAVPQPQLDVMAGPVRLTGNTGWTSGGGGPALTAAATLTGAFALGANSADAAVLVNLPAGSYTAMASAADGRAGPGLVEIYDVPAEGSAARLTNISTRAVVGAASETLIAGIVISGTLPQRVLVRAAGPALARYGVGSPLARPQLTVFAGETPVAQNTGWESSPDPAALAQAAKQAGAFDFATGSSDSALIATLAPGSYTAQVTSADGTTGVALVEIYELP